MIATYEGKRIIYGFNPDYWQAEDIHSYRVEVYTSIVSFLYINTYAEYFNIQITNTIHGLYDNEAYISKLNEIILNPKYIKYL